MRNFFNKSFAKELLFFSILAVGFTNIFAYSAVAKTDNLPAIVSKGDRFIVSKLFKDVELNDVVVVKADNGKKYICNVVEVSNNEATVQNNELGKLTVDLKDVCGEVVFRYYPFDKVGTLTNNQ